MKNRTVISAAILASLAFSAAGQTKTTPHAQPGAKERKQPTPDMIAPSTTTQTSTTGQTSTTNQTTATTNKPVVSTDPTVIANQPTREHLDLTRSLLGEWSTKVTVWTNTSQAGTTATTPTTSNGTARFYTTMGGRFVGTEFECPFNGQTMRGAGFYGYNNGEKRYESTWIDNQTSAIFFFTGVRQDNTITWNSTFTDPQNGEKVNLRAVEVFGDNTINYTLFQRTSGGGEFKKMEITYTRTGPGSPVEITPIVPGKKTGTNTGNTTNPQNTRK
ncbi:MAG: DUF1579 family protein [Phycisphaerae bacterium]|nr:DUF1579 family protein [Phycisphaerae bacterium]